MLSAFSKGFHVIEFVFLYHSLVGLIIEREKFINLKLIQQEYTKTAMSLMVDEMIEYSKDKHSLSCLVSPTGDVIIPHNRVLGKSRHQRVLDHLKDEKEKKRRENVMGNKIGKWQSMGTVERIGKAHHRMPVMERIGKAHQRMPVMGTIKVVRVEIIRARVIWLMVCD